MSENWTSEDNRCNYGMDKNSKLDLKSTAILAKNKIIITIIIKDDAQRGPTNHTSKEAAAEREQKRGGMSARVRWNEFIHV